MSALPEAPGGEFELIERLLARLGESAATSILVPPGDDAAAWVTPPGAATVASVDTLTEGTHWRADTMSYADVGWRAASTALSDLAAMGAQPNALLVAAVLGPALTLEQLDAFADGLAEGCAAHDVRVAGGDVVRGVATSFSVTVVGHVSPGVEGAPPPLLRRDAARPGDAVAVSGTLGAAAAGLALIDAGRAADAATEATVAPLLAAHRRPRARLGLGRAALDAGVRCAIDVSDGLLQDLGHIALASGVAIEVELGALPLHPAALALLGEAAARDLALGGGDDYELALAGPVEALAVLAGGQPSVTVIGRVGASSTSAGALRGAAAGVEGTRGAVRVLDGRGEPYAAPDGGWDQLRSAARPAKQP